jgi:cell wall-associated NlpC family hydrolase
VGRHSLGNRSTNEGPASDVTPRSRYIVRAAVSATMMAAAVAATAGPAMASAPAQPTAGTTTVSPSAVTGSSVGAAALRQALTRQGRPYIWGATGPNSFDCSGLVQWSFKQVGVTLPRVAEAQSMVGTPVSRAQLQPGDLVFFYSPVSHVGIYVGGGNVLNASTSGQPVKISSMAYMPFHNARRI